MLNAGYVSHEDDAQLLKYFQNAASQNSATVADTSKLISNYLFFLKATGDLSNFNLPESWKNASVLHKTEDGAQFSVPFWTIFMIERDEDGGLSLNFLYYLPKFKQTKDVLTSQLFIE